MDRAKDSPFPRPRSRNLLSHALRFFGLLLLLVLFFTVDWSRAPALLREADLSWLALAAVLNFAFILTKSVRWFLLLRIQRIPYGLARALRVYQAGSFLSVVTPGKIGDFAKAGYLRADLKIPLPVGIASVLIDRLLDLVTLAGWALAMIFFRAAAERFIPSILVFVALVAVGTAFLFTRRVGRALFSLVERSPGIGRIATRTRPVVREVFGVFFATRRVALLGPLAISILAYAILYGACFALARALHLPLTFFHVVYTVTVANVVALLPISISGIGTRDVAIVILFRDLGIASAHALLFSLGYLLLNLVFGHGPGAYFWLTGPMELRDLPRGLRDEGSTPDREGRQSP